MPFFSPAIPRTLLIGYLKIPFLKKWLALFQLHRLFPLEAFKRHAYIVAKSGSGKSELLKMLLLRLQQKRFWWPWKSPLRRTRTVILLDPHGETAEECAQQDVFLADVKRSHIQGKKPNLVYVTPSANKDQVPCVNPFDIGARCTKNDRDVLAQFLTKAFVSMLGKSGSDLSLNMRGLLLPILSVLLSRSARNPQKPSTFFDLALFLDDHKNEPYLRYAKAEHEDSSQRFFFQHMFSDPQYSSTKFALKAKLAHLLNLPMFVALLSQPRSTWHLSQLYGSGKTVIINASKSILGAEVTEVYGRTITALLQSYAFLLHEKRVYPTFYIVDEASNFVSVTAHLNEPV